MALPLGPQRWPLLIVGVLSCLVATSCAKTTAASTPEAGGTATASAVTPTGPPPAAAGNSTDYCALAEKIGTASGIMTNKHFVSPLKETLDMLKAVVNLSLAAKDQLATSLPANIKAAFQIEMQYFQALKDSNFDGTAAPPAGFDAANKTVNDYGVATCGFVFDQ
jgi:hypothetical protein